MYCRVLAKAFKRSLVILSNELTSLPGLLNLQRLAEASEILGDQRTASSNQLRSYNQLITQRYKTIRPAKTALIFTRKAVYRNQVYEDLVQPINSA